MNYHSMKMSRVDLLTNGVKMKFDSLTKLSVHLWVMKASRITPNLNV